MEFLAGFPRQRDARLADSCCSFAIATMLTPKVRALMDPLTGDGTPLTNPRPGHADYAGALKYRQRDLRNVLERASARETAMRVCLGAICAQFLAALGISTRSYVQPDRRRRRERPRFVESRRRRTAASCAVPTSAAAERMIARDRCRRKRRATRSAVSSSCASTECPSESESNRQPNQRLDGLLAGALMGMQTVRAVEIGLGADSAARPGSQAHDVFALESGDVVRASNRAGGIEGGMSNGQAIVVRVSTKPIPTLMKALPSVNLHAWHRRTGDNRSQRRLRRSRRRAIVGEAMLRLALIAPVLEKYGGDSMEETQENLRAARERGRTFRIARAER